MARPPMPDVITVYVTAIDPNTGQPVKDKYGVVKRTAVQSDARVKLSTELITNRNGDEVQATLKIMLPPETKVHVGDVVEWTDRWGVLYKDPIENMSEAKNYGGDVVYYTKAFTGRA